MNTKNQVSFRQAGVLLPMILLAIAGIYSAWFRSAFSFGFFDDQALFHTFGRWLLHGEAYITDFIHFRTPGPYYYYAFMQGLLGEEFRSTSFALLTEAMIGQTLATYLLALAATRALLGRASVWIAFCSALLMLTLPPIFQLRTALPALALAAYLTAQTQEDERARYRWLVATGALTGITYWFGQELFIFLCWTILAVEAISVTAALPVKAWRLVLIAGGALLVLVPTLLLLAISGTHLGEYFYYTLYYAFVIQPSGMDLPFPPLQTDTLIYYLPFVTIVASAVILTLTGRLGNPAAVALMGYAAVRLISTLGRSDFLHLLFSISETLVLVLVTLALIPEIRLSSARLIHSGVVATGLIVLFALAIAKDFVFLLSTPLVVAGAGRFGLFGKTGKPGTSAPAWRSALAAMAGFAAIFATFHPHSTDSTKFSLFASQLKLEEPVGNVNLPAPARAEIAEVRRQIEAHDADVIFSFPIRPIYYAFSKDHPTRLTYFEPQTTAEEYAATIAELERTPPPLVIKDLDQVGQLSPVLYPLADYITSRYRSIQIVVGQNPIEILRPRPEPVAARRLFDRIYALNPDRTAVTHGLRDRANDGPVLVIAVNRGEARFRFESGDETVLRLRVHADVTAAPTGLVELRRSANVSIHHVDVAAGQVALPLPSGEEPLEVILRGSGVDSLPVLWENPMLVEAEGTEE